MQKNSVLNELAFYASSDRESRSRDHSSSRSEQEEEMLKKN